jgi:FkbM family methyltransferase
MTQVSSDEVPSVPVLESPAPTPEAAPSSESADPSTSETSLPIYSPERPNPFLLLEGCRYGRFLVPPTDAYVGKAMMKYGEYSQIELEMILRFVSPDVRVVVAGANIGTLVVPLAQHAGEVLAFEPQRWVFQLLCANVALNGLINVRAVWAGCGARGGAISVPVLEPLRDNNFGALEVEACQQMPGDTVPVYALDRYPDTDCGLLTIDVEGMELDVLQGAENMIGRCQPIIWAEADRALKKKAVFDWLRQHAYDLYWYRTPLYNKDNWFKIEENVYMSDDGNHIGAENIIAVPKSRGITMNNFLPVLE